MQNLLLEKLLFFGKVTPSLAIQQLAADQTLVEKPTELFMENVVVSEK